MQPISTRPPLGAIWPRADTHRGPHHPKAVRRHHEPPTATCIVSNGAAVAGGGSGRRSAGAFPEASPEHLEDPGHGGLDAVLPRFHLGAGIQRVDEVAAAPRPGIRAPALRIAPADLRMASEQARALPELVHSRAHAFGGEDTGHDDETELVEVPLQALLIANLEDMRGLAELGGRPGLRPPGRR